MAEQLVVPLEDLPPGTAVRVELEGEPICVARRPDGEVRAVHDTCSHEEFSLAEGWISGEGVECALHGSVFDADTGRPLSLPAVRPIPTYACAVRDGGVWVDGAHQTNDAPVPRH